MNNSESKYLIIGAGGTGGAIGSHLAHAGRDVTFIARGRHLDAMRQSGLRVIKPSEEFIVDPVSAYTEDEYLSGLGSGDLQAADVIVVCLKGYSIDGIIPFIEKASGQDTIVIPVLNIYGTGGKMQQMLPGTIVTDGCIYVASEITEPGVILMKGKILRVVFGLRKDQKEQATKELQTKLDRIASDFDASGIEGILSDNIERDALRKFSYVSPQGAVGLYYGVPVGGIQSPGEIRDCFAGLVREISDLADAMGAGFGKDIAEENLRISDGLLPEMTTSLQRDIARGSDSEIDGLIYEVPRLAKRYGTNAPLYEKISAELRSRGL